MENRIKTVLYGSSGHWGITLASKKADIAAYCPGIEGEDTEAVTAKLRKAGHDPKLYADYEKMLDEIKPQAVIVDPVYNRHFYGAKAAADRGMAVFCEKPVAFTLDECGALRRSAEQHGTILWAMQTWRYEPALYTCKKLIERGAIGKVKLLNGQKSYKLGVRPEFYGERARYGGTIPWVAIHAIDAILFVCPSRVNGVFAGQSSSDNGGNGSLETTGVCVLTLEGGVFATVTCDYYRPENAPTHGDDRLRVVGTKGILEIRDEKLYLIDKDNDGTRPLECETPPDFFGDFLDAAASGKKGLIDTESSILSTQTAIRCRDFADGTGKE
jgi:predicted dehydrogenase